MWVGVSTQKNPFGLMCAISVFFMFWAFIRDWRTKDLLKNKSRVLSEALVFFIAVRLLLGSAFSYSATAMGMLIVGISLLLVLHRKKNLVRFIANVVVFAVPIALLSLHFSELLGISFTSILGRDSTFTGRTTIWASVSEVASRNPWFGVGFGGYWGLANWATSSITVEAHNGYLDVYLNIGMVGIVLLLAFLLAHFRRVLRELNHSYDWGVFGICSLVMLLLANYTEGSFLGANFMWSIPVFLTIVFSAPFLHK